MVVPNPCIVPVPSNVVVLVEKLELSAVILVEKLPESVFKLVTLVEKLELSAVIRVEKDPESVDPYEEEMLPFYGEI